MKKTLPELKPAPNQMPGFGLLTLQGWETPAPSLENSFEVCVQRNQDHRFLGADLQWTATQTWHQVDATESQNEYVALTLGPSIVDPLVENPQMTYLLQARFGQELAQGVMRIREGVLSSHAAGQTGEAVSRVAKPLQGIAPEPTIRPEPTAPVITGASDPQAEPASKQKSASSRAPLIIAIVVLFVLLAAYFGWQSYQGQQAVTATTTTPTATSAPPVTNTPAASPPPASAVGAMTTPQEPVPCSSEALSATKDDLSFIQSCLKASPDTAKVLAVIELAKAAKRCDIAQRLYAFKAQAGDVVIALAYAKEFDPQFFVAGCLTAADKNTALYWYDLVLSKDATHAQAKERSEALRK